VSDLRRGSRHPDLDEDGLAFELLASSRLHLLNDPALGHGTVELLSDLRRVIDGDDLVGARRRNVRERSNPT